MPQLSRRNTSDPWESMSQTSRASVVTVAPGVLSPFHCGKVQIAMPSIRQSFSLGLLSASWILSALNVADLFDATPTGTICSRAGTKRAIVIGLSTIAIAMACHLVENLGAGVLLRRGFSLARIIVQMSIFTAFMTIGIFLLLLPFPAFYLSVLLLSSVAGLVLSAVMRAASFHTRSPFLLGATNGLLVQGSNLVIIVGPPLMSLIATRLGWNWGHGDDRYSRDLSRGPRIQHALNYALVPRPSLKNSYADQ